LLTSSPVAIPAGGSETIHVQVEIPALMRDVVHGSDTFTLTVTSVGGPDLVLTAVGTTDSVTVTLAGHSWQTVAQPESVGPLAPGKSAPVQVTVTVSAGQADSITVRLTSKLDEEVWAEMVLTSQTHLLFLPLVLRRN
jgi:hypothetical protein